jgi:hypothetical protein
MPVTKDEYAVAVNSGAPLYYYRPFTMPDGTVAFKNHGLVHPDQQLRDFYHAYYRDNIDTRCKTGVDYLNGYIVSERIADRFVIRNGQKVWQEDVKL